MSLSKIGRGTLTHPAFGWGSAGGDRSPPVGFLPRVSGAVAWKKKEGGRIRESSVPKELSDTRDRFICFLEWRRAKESICLETGELSL
jgi:hypothetical protein